MTPEQYERWKDFACRMALNAFPSYREANRKKIERFVRDFFWRQFDGEAETIEGANSWDQGPDVYVCDLMSEFETDGIGVARRRQGLRTGDFLTSVDRKEFGRIYKGWQGQDMEDFWEYRRKLIWTSPVSCCVHAGLDVVAEPSAGVVGFDVGDLRRMYPEGLPDWVAAWFTDPITADTPDAQGVWL